ncbi:outer membrane assembly protein AsmA [Orbaceae bacterium ESL0727]|nr:outer membrane assembly protein AsmA [Orbaceae bacterium ESL0727]
MIKKIVITLFILIMVIVIGIIALVVLIDPNNFKGFISDTVKDKTGYELTIDGNLRWHIWPQISILTDSVTLSDVGAAKPILTADNMRLDVELLPLLSKDLAVKNVLVKSAVINITDESKGDVFKQNNSQTTTAQTDDATPKTPATSANKNSHWSFTLDKLVVANSTVVLQKENDFINFRNIEIAIAKKDQQNVTVELSGNVNRDQQDLIYSLNADVNLNQFPQKAVIDLKNVTYDYKGVSVPTGELQGSMSATVNYQQSPLLLESKNIQFSVNGIDFSGSVTADLEQKPSIDLTLNSDKVDVTPFLNNQKRQTESVTIQQTTPVVTSNAKVSSNELNFLNNFNGKVLLNSKQIIINKIELDNVNVNANNQDGIATFDNISFNISGGNIKANGIANGKQKVTEVKLATVIKDVDLGSLFMALEIPNDLKGSLNANGDITTNTLNSDAILMALQGQLAVSVTKARLDNINIPNIIQTAVAQYTKDVATPENQQKYTELHELSTHATISRGNMNLTALKARSETLNVDGSGRVGIVNQDLDVDLQIQMLSGWNGKSDVIAKLQKVVVPLRIYGQFSKLNYQVEVDKLLKDLFNDKLQQGLDKLRDRFKQGDKSESESKSNSKQKAANMLGGLINRL